ncbi:MAG: hypothetical protein Kow006_11560 [Gammaproteobacteria bacterium]
MNPPSRDQSHHRTITAVLVALALLTSVLAALLVLQAYERTRQAERLLHIIDLSYHLNMAAGVFAVERGLTAGLLGDPSVMRPDTAERIRHLRLEADQALEKGLAIAEALRPLMSAQRGFASALDELKFARVDLLERRSQIAPLFKRQPIEMKLDAWFATTTRLIENIQLVERVSVATIELPHDIGWLMLDVGQAAWRAAEYLGRERGLLAYYVSAQRPVPEALQHQLLTHQGVVNLHVASIQKVADHASLSDALRERIERMERQLDDNYIPLRRQVLLAAKHGTYPIDGPSWIASATLAVNSLLDIGRTVTQEAQRNIHDIVAHNQRQLLAMVILMVVSLLMTGIGLWKIRSAARALSRERELAEVTLNTIGDAVITTDKEQIIRYINPVAESLTGWRNDQAVGLSLTAVYKTSDSYTGGKRTTPVETSIAENRVVALGRDVVLTRRNGEEIRVQDSATPMRDARGDVRGAVLVFYDTSSLRSAPHLLTYHAHHDPLTGLYNRREFERRLEELVIAAREGGEHHALCFVDLDNFKVINDTCGHEAGDKLLQQITYLLGQRVRDNDTLARIGGDEFAVLLRGCDTQQALQIAQALCDLIKEYRFSWQDKVFEVGASIGVVPITRDVATATQVLGEADAACYAAKEQGRNQVQLFTPDDLELAQRRSEKQWLPRLQQALKNGHFVLYAQPVLPAGDGPVMCELLVRLSDEESHLLQPGSFLPAAERHQLTPELDRWVIDATLAAIQAEPAERVAETLFTINLTAPSLEDDALLDFIGERLAHYQIPPRLVCFEITETATALSLRQASRFIEGLHEIGCLVALDDFGTGLSSLAHLKSLNVDYLKIAAPFIRDIARDEVAAAMVEAIGSVARLMGIQTVAEYVTTPDAVQRLRDLGIDYLQGYAVAKPQPFSDAVDWMHRQQPTQETAEAASR